MNGLINAANADEIVLHYERSIIAGDRGHADNLKFIHTDLAKRFAQVDERIARKP